MVINIYNRNNRGQNVKVLMLIGKYFVLIISFKLGVSGFPFLSRDGQGNPVLRYPAG
jgi:hypothetical protein